MRRRPSEKGAATVEFAIIFLLLMIIVFGIIEFGFLWLQSFYIANAAAKGVGWPPRTRPFWDVVVALDITALKEQLYGLAPQ